MSKLKKIGVLTSGGDSPGMNACIRAVVRSAVSNDVEVVGIYRGFEGLIQNEMSPLDSRSVSNIIQRGGTILKSARSAAFLTEQGRQKASEHYKNAGLEGLIVIGGDGSFRGAAVFAKEFGTKVIGIPGTIDNDIFGTDFTLGFDTAVNNAIWAIDRIRDTADSHNRLFFIEVMGRDSGQIALWSGIASGAEAILLPEKTTDIDKLLNELHDCRSRGKTSMIVVVCEGDDSGGALAISEKIKAKTSAYEIRVTLLGHVQRGGNPTVFDRVLGSRLGEAAVNAICSGQSGQMVGIRNQQIAFTDFQSAVAGHEPLNPELLRLTGILST
ncbi:MAG TPA: 6-phosphofructokinase [Bacteroidia bacterium]|nr:6-phosphofructokinase [Bacteroidia bacterium]